MTQKFNRGDLVKVADKMPPHKSHFDCGMTAYIVGSYADQYDGGSREETIYTIMFEWEPGKWTKTSWYDQNQLTLIKKRDMKSIEFVEKRGRK